MADRGTFGSRLGIILATAGSAVGLGNVWRFPYMTGQNGGAAFIIIYLACILLLGIPGMVSEFIVGRHSQTNAARAYASFSRGKAWGLVGVLGIITSTIILGFYAVVAGWCLHYLGASTVGKLKGDASFVQHYFQTFSSDPVKPAILGIVFILITHFIIVRGVRNGIERASKLLMPLLFILLLIITYASYFTKHTKLLHSATQIALIDFLIALMSGLMIFPAAFSVGVQPDSGPSLIFITLPNVFQQAFSFMPILGYVISIMFYALLVFAALTSTISMHEIGTAFFHEELHINRSKAAWVLTIVCSVIAVFCSMSVGKADIQLFGKPLMEFCDYITAQIMLPGGALLTSILVGWCASKAIVREEFTNWETSNSKSYFSFYIFCVRYIVPISILLILMHQFGVI